MSDPYPSAPESLVVPVEKNGEKGVLKASASDAGRVMNEGNYIGEMRSRSNRMLGTKDGFPMVLMPPTFVSLTKSSVCAFVEERLLCSLKELDAVWNVHQVAFFAQQMIRRLQVLHTQENSLGLVHSDLKPENIMVNQDMTCYYLIDFDCATAIPSVKPRTAGKLKKVQGTYTYSGIDVLNGDYPSPKSDLDSLGQIFMWLLNGKKSVWSGSTLDQLKKEKLEWRETHWNNRKGTKSMTKEFQQYFEMVESLQSTIERPDYEKLVRLFENIAADKIEAQFNKNVPQQSSKRTKSVIKKPEPKENSSSNENEIIESPKKKKVVPKKKAVRKSRNQRLLDEANEFLSK